MLSCECGQRCANIAECNQTDKTERPRLTIQQNIQNLFLISSSPRISGHYIRNQNGRERERKRQLVAFPGIIHPFSDFRWYWDIFMTLVLLLALACQPVQLAFYSANENEDPRVIIVSSIVACIFFLDIFFNFQTGFQNSQSDLVVLEHSTIHRHYLYSWFFIDFLSSIPFDTLYFIVLHTVDLGFEIHLYYKVIRLVGMLKVFRLFRAVRCLERLEKAYKLTELRARLVNLLVMIFTILHWLACWHWLVADLFNPPGHRKEFSWITRTKLWDKPTWFCYINAALRAISNMGCLGYGGNAGEAPLEPEDIIATLISIMIGATCFTLYIGTMTDIVQSSNASEKKFNEIMNQVQEYMKFRRIPSGLQDKISTYYDHRYKGHYFDESLILGSLSGALESKLMMTACEHLVDKVELFKSLPESLIRKLVSKLKFETFLPGDIIIHANEEGEEMYFIQDGSVVIKSIDGDILSTLESGDHFGEISLVMEGHKTMANVVAQDYCDVYRLDKNCFREVFKNHSDLIARLHAIARRREDDTKRKISSSSTSKKYNLTFVEE